MTVFRTLTPGYGLVDGDDLNIVIDAVNAALKASNVTSVRPVSRVESGYRLFSGDILQQLNLAERALGLNSPVSPSMGEQLGYRLFSGELVTRFGANVGVVPGTPSGAGGSITPVVPVVVVPAAPTIGTPVISSGQVSLPFTDGATGGATITSHKIYEGPSSSALTLLGTITTASPFVDTGLTNGTARYYAISAVNSAGEGPMSAVVSATPSASQTTHTADSTTATADTTNLTADAA